MTRRHYGIRVHKARLTPTDPERAAAWSGDAFIWAIVVILIVLGVVLYRVGKIVTDVVNTTASPAPQTANKASRAL